VSGGRPSGSGRVGPKRPHDRPEGGLAAGGSRSGAPLKMKRSSHPAASLRLSDPSVGTTPQAPHRGSFSGLKLWHVFGTATRRHPVTAEHNRTRTKQRPTSFMQVGRCFR
jgi:hypothetical protein